ncbi:FG-GAP repeat domain-containing protein [Hyphomonas oceanitis]|uniref:Invasin/intimin cell-adhesion domain-containing protein n=1 Tax=Hyphomonas oceanitis SCH89 TaxID=1280953 RepID=A0A059G2V9_9PROT|nr:VCBS repeat-containing protein [Hyphomonas oceanitis]KDA01151.1 invasin/intimin cell-adhesion domain-containing protein [Hyphomonas oceanitis SCH89]
MKQIMLNTKFVRPVLMASALLVVTNCQTPETRVFAATSATSQAAGDTPSQARTKDGLYISWREHLIDDQQTNGGTAIRGGDGLVIADLDGDGVLDIVSVHEDSNHLRIAFGTSDADTWINVTVAAGDEVGAIEDVAVGDINGDGWPDLVAACEEAHLLYLQNPGKLARKETWPRMIPKITQGRGSWLRVFMADMDQDGHLDVLAANKGAADIIDPSLASAARPTSLFRIEGDPLVQSSWHEQVLSREVVPNTAMPIDIDDDGDMDVLVAARLDLQMAILETVGNGTASGFTVKPHPITIVAGMPVPDDWRGASSAFQSAFADIDGDGRKDLVVAVHETPQPVAGSPLVAGLGWLKQPQQLDEPWTFFRIGDTLPDIVAGIGLADIDGDGDLDAITGGYSGLNILRGAYTDASREEDSPQVTAASSVGRIA